MFIEGCIPRARECLQVTCVIQKAFCISYVTFPFPITLQITLQVESSCVYRLDRLECVFYSRGCRLWLLWLGDYLSSSISHHSKIQNHPSIYVYNYRLPSPRERFVFVEGGVHDMICLRRHTNMPCSMRYTSMYRARIHTCARESKPCEL